LLIVVQSRNRPKTFAKSSLRYIARSGFDYRIYIRKKEYQRYYDALKEAEDKYRLFIPDNVLRTNRVRIPKRYKLAFYMLDNIKGLTEFNLLMFCREIGKMRKYFNQQKNLVSIMSQIGGEYGKMVKLR
jgi:hypothetical protein